MTCQKGIAAFEVTNRLSHIGNISGAVLDFLNCKSNFLAEKNDTVLNDESAKLYLPVNEKEQKSN